MSTFEDAVAHTLSLEGGSVDDPQTLGALESYFDRRGAEGMEVLLVGLNCLQGARYVRIAEGSPDSEKFIYGWLKNRVSA